VAAIDAGGSLSRSLTSWADGRQTTSGGQVDRYRPDA